MKESQATLHGSSEAALYSDSPEATRRLGGVLAALLRAGDVLPLLGGFGAGKTTFAQGVARGVGALREAASPSFGLVHVYPGRDVDLYHLDLYRVQSLAEALGFGVEEILYGDGAVLVEWPDVVAELLPADRLSVELERVSDLGRRIVVRASGPRSTELLSVLTTAAERL